MNDYYNEILKEMYQKCLDSISSKKSEPSLLISVLSRSSNTVKRALVGSAYQTTGTVSPAIADLTKEKYLQEISPGKYTLTAKGLLYVEFELNHLDKQHYLNWLDSQYLSIGNEPISDKNRVVLLALFANRCFTRDTSATYLEPAQETKFLEMISESKDFLFSLGKISDDCLDAGKSKSKTVASWIMSQVDKLPKSTGMKFVSAGDGHYFIDVMQDDAVDRQSITFIARIILGNPSTEDVKKLNEFCQSQYLKNAYYFATGSHDFSDSRTQFVIENGILDAAM